MSEDKRLPNGLFVPSNYEADGEFEWHTLGFQERDYDDDGNTHIDGGRHAYTISPDPNVQGWKNDSGYYGYGLPREVAEELVRRYNAFPEMERRLREVARVIGYKDQTK